MGILRKTSIFEVQKDVLLVINNLDNLHGFVFNVTMFERFLTAIPFKDGREGYAGVDGIVIETIMKAMNASPNYHYPQDGQHYGRIKNGTITGGLRDIVHKNSEIASNSRFLHDYGIHGIEFTEYVYCDKLIVIIPKYSPIPNGLKILRIFQRQTWCVIVLIFLASIMIIYIRNLLIPLTSYSSIQLLKIYGIILGAAVKIQMTRKYAFLQCFWMFFSIIMIGIFQGTLIQSFSTLMYYNNVDTLEELAESNLQIRTSLEIFDWDQSVTMRKLFGKIVEVNDNENDWLLSLYKLCIYKNFSLVGRESEIRHIKYNIILAKDGTRCLHTVKEHIMSPFFVYIVPHYSPYLLKINDLIIKLRESGLIEYWIENARLQKYNGQKNYHSFKNITYDDLLVFLYILFSGHILAFLIFLYEIKMANIRKCFKFRNVKRS